MYDELKRANPHCHPYTKRKPQNIKITNNQRWVFGPSHILAHKMWIGLVHLEFGKWVFFNGRPTLPRRLAHGPTG